MLLKRSWPLEQALRAACLMLAITMIASMGCSGRQLHRPRPIDTPYLTRQLWAVIPPANESGFSNVAVLDVADAITSVAQSAPRIDTIPVNRVLLAMKALQLEVVDSPDDVAAIMKLLELDGAIVSTITAWDPYQPIEMGLAMQLFMTDDTAGTIEPVAQAAGIFACRNHHTLRALEGFAKGRSAPDTAFGSDIYQVSMDLYAEFVAYQLLSDVMEQEKTRLYAWVRAHD
jgi:hypothetical protein